MCGYHARRAAVRDFQALSYTPFIMAISSIIRSIRGKPYRNIFVSLIAVILIDALSSYYTARGLFADLMVAALLLAALVETVRARHNAIWAAILGLPAIILRFVSAFTEDSPNKNSAILVLTAVFIGFLIWNLLHDLNTGGRSTSEMVFGALVAYILIGMLFALMFTHLEYRDPGSFSASNQAVGEVATSEAKMLPNFVYFSFVTMTTLGYGDITPLTERARTLAWLEALIGQLYLAVMVAGFVAKHISQRIQKPPGDEERPSRIDE